MGDIKKSLQERALESKKALLIGIGGGGDIIQTIPVGNYLKLLGVDEIYYAGVACEWWPFDAEGEHEYIMAPTVYGIDELENAEEVAPHIARVTKESTYKGRKIAEGTVAGILGNPAYVLSHVGGVQGLIEGVEKLCSEEGIDLVVGMDVGSDSFYSHTDELAQPRTPLVDLMTVSMLTSLSVPSVYGLSGYGCDGEIELVDLKRNVGRVMKGGGYLGAYGLTQRDVADMEIACDAFPDPVERWPVVAAKGDLTKKNMKLMDAWGVIVDLTPLTSVIMFFDPQTLVTEVATPAKDIGNSSSLTEAEKIFIEKGIVPETRLPKSVNYLSE